MLAKRNKKGEQRQGTPLARIMPLEHKLTQLQHIVRREEESSCITHTQSTFHRLLINYADLWLGKPNPPFLLLFLSEASILWGWHPPRTVMMLRIFKLRSRYFWIKLNTHQIGHWTFGYHHICNVNARKSAVRKNMRKVYLLLMGFYPFFKYYFPSHVG
jgi:hypothetical protein